MEEGVWSKVINSSEQVFIGVFLLHMSRGVYLKKRTRLVKWKWRFQRKLCSLRGNTLKGWDYRTIAEGAACSHTLPSAPKLTSSWVIYSILISEGPSQKQGLWISPSVQTGRTSFVLKISQCHLISSRLKASRTTWGEASNKEKILKEQRLRETFLDL